MITNEQIKAEEIELTGLNGEDLGIVPTREALRMAKEYKVDLICLSLAMSPPPCRLMRLADFKKQADQGKKKERKSENSRKIKEIRLTPMIEEHDLDTKVRQAERILAAGDAVVLAVRLEKKQDQIAARECVKTMISRLKAVGKQEKGIQVSAKQVMATVQPME